MNKFFCLIIFVFSLSAHAQYHQTLPKGIRLFMARHIQTDVKSTYNHSSSEAPLSYEIQTDIRTLETIENTNVQEALAFMSQYPEAYEKINLGTHKIDANADVKVDAYVLGWGITDKLMGYLAIPVYQAKVELKYKKTSNDTNNEVAEILQNNTNDDLSQAVGKVLEGISGPDGSTVQNAIVNGFGYEEIGSWQGQGLGDIEFGLMYNLVNQDNYGFKLTLGGTAPTGYVDDPDIIQDFGFGDGQWDAFAEFGGGLILSKYLTLNSWVRYTHQFESEKELRVPLSEDITLSDTKEEFTEKLGNKIDFGVNLEVHITDWLTFEPSYLYTQTAKATYESDNSEGNRLLSSNTDSNSHSIKLLAALSTVNLYKQKKFILPAQIKASFQQMVEGRNTPRSDRFELEFSMFF